MRDDREARDPAHRDVVRDKKEPERVPLEKAIPDDAEDNQLEICGWIFIGDKKEQKDLKRLYRDAITELPNLLITKTDEYCFGAEAFRAWAADIENGRFNGVKPKNFNAWCMYTNYVCNLATNGSCCHSFLEKAYELNTDMEFLTDISDLYHDMEMMWNKEDGKDLEALGGGFNVSLKVLQNKKKRDKIVAKIREFANCADEILRILNENINDGGSRS